VPERSGKPVPREGDQQGGLDGATMLDQAVVTPAKFVRRGQAEGLGHHAEDMCNTLNITGAMLKSVRTVKVETGGVSELEDGGAQPWNAVIKVVVGRELGPRDAG